MLSKIKKCMAFFLCCCFCFVCFAGCLGNPTDPPNSPPDNTPDAPPEISTVALPIVLYHRLLPEGHPALNETAVTLTQFEDDLKYIKQHNYNTVTFQQVLDFANGTGTLPENPIMITFDDGYYNNYYYGMPLLQKYSMKASLAVICDYINAADEKFTGDDNYGYCTWDMIREMQDSGTFEITSHTYSMHVQDPRLGVTRKNGESEADYRNALRDDITKWKNTLKQQLDIDYNILIYPYGCTVDTAGISILQEQEVELTCIVSSSGANIIKKGKTDNLYNLRRYNRVYSTSTEPFFKLMLERHQQALQDEIE